MENILNFITTPVGTILLSILIIIFNVADNLIDKLILNQKKYEKVYSTTSLLDYTIGAFFIYLLYKSQNPFNINWFYAIYITLFEFIYLKITSKVAKNNITIITSIGTAANVLALAFLIKKTRLMLIILIIFNILYLLFLNFKNITTAKKGIIAAFLIILLHEFLVFGEEIFWILLKDDSVLGNSIVVGYLIFLVLNSLIKKTLMFQPKLLFENKFLLIKPLIGSSLLALIIVAYKNSILEIYLIINSMKSIFILLTEQKQDKSPKSQTIKLFIILFLILIIGYLLKTYLTQ